MRRTESVLIAATGAALAVALLFAGGTSQAAVEPESVGLVDTATGQWSLRAPTGEVTTFRYGNPGDAPFMGDWDCDGIDTPGLYRRSDGFVYLRNSNTRGIADVEYFFGNPGDVAVPGDFDGDGCDTVSIYRPAEARFYIINSLGDGQGGLGKADFDFRFGDPGDTPYVGDFDGDGIDEVGLRRESAGSVYFRNTLDTGIADLDFFYGNPGDAILAADWTGDGIATVAIYRPATQRFYLRHTNTPGVADAELPMAGSGVPVHGRFGPLDPDPPSDDIVLTRVASGLDAPVFLDAPAGDNRLFVVERDGRIRIIEDGVVKASPFLDIDPLTNGGGEGGLLGLAFHPDYAANGRFFVNHTDLSGDTVVAEYRVSADPDVADRASRREVLKVDQPAGNHNGGMIAFDPVYGYLWIGMGDGGGGNDTYGNGQNTATLLGAMLRIDVDGAAPYAVPPDNPFVGGPGADEIWAYGLRNPWRFSFDEDALYIGDVGQGAWEEIDVALVDDAGVNYGWPIMEGAHCLPGTNCSFAGLRLPALEYSHADGCSVTGGYVYRGDAIPALHGTYFYSDFCSGWLRSFRYEGGQATDRRTWPVGTLPTVSSFGTDGHNNLYILSLSGAIYRVDSA